MKNCSKSQVEKLARLVCGSDDVEVRGARAKGRSGGDYLTEVAVRGRVIARARHRNWRMSYKVLSVELSKAAVF
jgi:hypothetical protein